MQPRGCERTSAFGVRVLLFPGTWTATVRAPQGRTQRTHEERPQIAAAQGNAEPRINDRIRAREVRLVSAEGEQVGIKPLPEALAMAREQGFDLVEVADKANPPVCRIMDYGKYKYEAAQRAKESRKKASNVSVKEMKYRPKIGQGDFDTKTRKVEHFLAEGHRVKLTIMFRGREIYHKDLGEKILDQVAERVEHLAKVEVFPRIDGRNMTMVLAPDKKAQAAHARKLASEAAQEQEVQDDDSGPQATADTEAGDDQPATNEATLTPATTDSDQEPEPTTDATADDTDAPPSAVDTEDETPPTDAASS